MNISWTAPEYMHTEKTADWYWIVGIVSVTLSVISIVFGNILFGLFIIVATGTLTLYASRPPELHEIRISDKGVQVDKVLYPYHSIESFWIEEKELHPRILLKSEKKIAPYIVILLGEVPAEEIRDALNTHLHEVKHSEPFLEKLLIWFGF
jgi:hypothetical protein